MILWRSVVIISLVAPAFAGLFDFSEFDDPFSTLAQLNNNGLLRNSFGGTACNVTDRGGETSYGICKPSLDCRLTVGDVVGRGTCGGLLQCCIYTGQCNSITSKKVAYFNSPSNVPDSGECTYTVKAANKNVCQIRLDFDKFELLDETVVTGGTTGYECRDDFLDITAPNKFRVPVLCGHNTGQHMYIPMNASNDELSIKLEMKLADRIAGQAKPSWRIRITQFECPTHQYKLSSTNGYDLARDFNELAPPGCLQYFPERVGTVSNFGYDSGKTLANNHYLINQNYAICFRRTPSTCGIRFTSPNFMLAPGAVAGAAACGEDYLYIPEAAVTTTTAGLTITVVDYKFCGATFDNTVTVKSLVPAPLYVHFHTDNVMSPTGVNEENGFQLNWEVLSGNSC